MRRRDNMAILIVALAGTIAVVTTVRLFTTLASEQPQEPAQALEVTEMVTSTPEAIQSPTAPYSAMRVSSQEDLLNLELGE